LYAAAPSDSAFHALYTNSLTYLLTHLSLHDVRNEHAHIYAHRTYANTRDVDWLTNYRIVIIVKLQLL